MRRNIFILLFILCGNLVFAQCLEVGYVYQSYKMKGNRIVDISPVSTMPDYILTQVNDVYPISSLLIGGFMPFKNWHIEQKSIGFTERMNLGYSSGRNTNSAGLKATYFYTFNLQSYLSFKSGVGSITTQQYGKRRSGPTGWGFGIGFEYGSGVTDYYKDKMNYKYLLPSINVEFSLEIKDLGIIRFMFYKSLGKKTLKYKAYTGKIPTIGISDFGFGLAKVF